MIWIYFLLLLPLIILMIENYFGIKSIIICKFKHDFTDWTVLQGKARQSGPYKVITFYSARECKKCGRYFIKE